MTATELAPDVGRVLYASTSEYAFGCAAADAKEGAPEFGALVRSESTRAAVYGLVYDVRVSDDPLVRQLAVSRELAPEYVADQLYNRHVPVELAALAVGYRMPGGALCRGLPPHPPMNLDRVFACPQDELAEFSERCDYFALLLSTGTPVPAEELLAAHLRQAADARPEAQRRAFLVRAGRELARLLTGDLLRLDAILTGDLLRLDAILRRLKG